MIYSGAGMTREQESESEINGRGGPAWSPIHCVVVSKSTTGKQQSAIEKISLYNFIFLYDILFIKLYIQENL